MNDSGNRASRASLRAASAISRQAFAIVASRSRNTGAAWTAAIRNGAFDGSCVMFLLHKAIPSEKESERGGLRCAAKKAGQDFRQHLLIGSQVGDDVLGRPDAACARRFPIRVRQAVNCRKGCLMAVLQNVQRVHVIFLSVSTSIKRNWHVLLSCYSTAQEFFITKATKATKAERRRVYLKSSCASCASWLKKS